MIYWILDEKRNLIMHWILNEKEHQERLQRELLRREGFTEQSINQLDQLRRTYAQDQLDQPDIRHLEFARWLVTTGRLTDMLPERQNERNDTKAQGG